jgi:capsule polysaccharide export protein KpsE/RkpR
LNKNISYYKDLIKKHFFTFFITFFIIFSLALVYAYFAQRVYLSDATIEVIKYKQNSGLNNNPLQIAIKENSPEDESEILKSNLLVNKAIKQLNLNVELFHYKGKKHFAIDEEEFPLNLEIFEIKNKNIYNRKLNIIPINNEEYQISIDTSSLMGKIKGSDNNLIINESYKYGEIVENKNFRLLVTKKLDKE